MTPRDAAKIKILDPACGSGSFLLGAYRFLIDWHQNWYEQNGPENFAKGKSPALFQGQRGQWRLTSGEKKRILLNNIHGVDIDPQAVEVTKLSLLLQVLEGESEETLRTQLGLFKERALPDLGGNIKCGNSLIGWDFFSGQLSPDPELVKKINPFDWEREFPSVFLTTKDTKDTKKKEKGGFDAVIGNPPYIRIQNMKEWAPVEVEIYKEQYLSASAGNYDIYVVFAEKGLSLLNPNGKLGFILPHKFFNAQYGEPLRKIISAGKHLSEIVHFGDQQVFSGATTYCCLLFLKSSPVDDVHFMKVTDLADWRISNNSIDGQFSEKTISSAEWNFSTGAEAGTLKRMRTLPTKLGDVSHIFQGLVTGADKVFIVPLSSDIEPELTKPFLHTGNLSAYSPFESTARIIFPYLIRNGKAILQPAEDLKKKYPKGWDYLCSHRDELMNRENGKWRHKQWYAFGRSQNLTQMGEDKLIIQVTSQSPTVLFDDEGLYMTGGGSGPFYGIRPLDSSYPIKYLLGITNSKLFGVIIKSQSTTLRGGYIKYSKQYIETTPIVLPDAVGKNRMATLCRLVDDMMRLKKSASNTTLPSDRETLQRQIAATDRQIDTLVYELYGLTDEEIKIVEGAK